MSAGFELVIFLSLFVIITGLLFIIIPLLFAPKRPNPVKAEPFECGQPPTGEGRVHFMMQYYAYLLMFVVFDVVVMFLFAWGVAYLSLGVSGALIITTFLTILIVPLGYALYLAGKRIW